MLPEAQEASSLHEGRAKKGDTSTKRECFKKKKAFQDVRIKGKAVSMTAKRGGAD